MTDTMLTHDGITQPITEWALDYGIYPAVITDRLARGWTASRAITAPMVAAPRQRLDAQHMRGLTIAPRRVRAGSNARRFEHDGRALTVREWSIVCRSSVTTINCRLKRGWPIANALTGKAPGVVENLPPLEGTGGGSLAQDISEIEFLQ
ncbi:hypothetical protein [Devosia sp. 2618]|uniref:hypothetical protein n=1 Tax=Devosia sp. 2618 TaxID=3156454 RepID=UPI003398DD16